MNRESEGHHPRRRHRGAQRRPRADRAQLRRRGLRTPSNSRRQGPELSGAGVGQGRPQGLARRTRVPFLSPLLPSRHPHDGPDSVRALWNRRGQPRRHDAMSVEPVRTASRRSDRPFAPHDRPTSASCSTTSAAFSDGDLDLTHDDLRFFGSKVWQIVTSCRERRDTDYEKIGWWEFIGAEHRSLAYQKLLGHGITRSLVAAKARTASTKTIGDIFVQLLFDIVTPGPSTDRVLNGPTNDVWIDPWRRYLESQGVDYHPNSKAIAVSFDGQRIRSATISQGGSTITVTRRLFHLRAAGRGRDRSHHAGDDEGRSRRCPRCSRSMTSRSG